MMREVVSRQGSEVYFAHTVRAREAVVHPMIPDLLSAPQGV